MEEREGSRKMWRMRAVEARKRSRGKEEGWKRSRRQVEEKERNRGKRRRMT